MWVNILNWFCLYSPIDAILHFVEFFFCVYHTYICTFVYITWVALLWKEKCALVYFNFAGVTLIVWYHMSASVSKQSASAVGKQRPAHLSQTLRPLWRLATANHQPSDCPILQRSICCIQTGLMTLAGENGQFKIHFHWKYACCNSAERWLPGLKVKLFVWNAVILKFCIA